MCSMAGTWVFRGMCLQGQGSVWVNLLCMGKEITLNSILHLPSSGDETVDL